MTARYLIRFDDVCPSMNWVIWEQIEAILSRHNIKPILAVVPDNKDPKLGTSNYTPDFWERVRCWQSAGWSIGLHGYQHVYETNYAGIVGHNNYSEFAGLPYSTQRNKLLKAIEIFKREGLLTNLWIAPAHSFDITTVRILAELEINVISDGYYRRPVQNLGSIWIPQQIWRFRPFISGLWTVCYHHNNWRQLDISRFESDISTFARSITSLTSILDNENILPINFLDHAFSFSWKTRLNLMQLAKKITSITKTRF